MNKILGLKRLDTNNTGYNGFEYPDVGGTVVCPDWDPEATCKNGLFFITEDACAFDLSGREGDWIVAELENVVTVDGEKVKARVAKVIHRSSSKYAPVEWMPEGFAEKWVAQDGNALQFIKNPSIEMQKIAVAQNGHAIYHIDNPSIEVQKIAVEQDWRAIRHIKNPSIEMQKIAVAQSGYAIYHIDNPSEEVQRIARIAMEHGWNTRLLRILMEQDGYAIRYIDNPSKEMQKIASEEMRKIAVTQNGYAIQCIDNPSEEV